MNTRKIILAAAAIALFSAFGTGPSAAYDYPFCRKGEGGPGDCRYDTYQQCLDAISGTAGWWQARRSWCRTHDRARYLDNGVSRSTPVGHTTALT